MKTLAQILEQAQLSATQRTSSEPEVTVVAEANDSSNEKREASGGDSPREDFAAQVVESNVIAAKLVGAKIPRRIGTRATQVPPVFAPPVGESAEPPRADAVAADHPTAEVASAEVPAEAAPAAEVPLADIPPADIPPADALPAESPSENSRSADVSPAETTHRADPPLAQNRFSEENDSIAPVFDGESSVESERSEAPPVADTDQECDGATAPAVGEERDKAGAWRIAAAGPPTAWESVGGGEIQLTATMDALRRSGIEARPWRPWEESLAEFDCLHLFGSVPEHLPLVEAAKRQGVAVALSPVAWFDWRNCLREPGSRLSRWAAAARFGLRTAWPRVSSWRRRLYHAVDLLLPNSHAEAEQLARLFNVPMSRIQVTPNGADPSLADADPQAFRELVGLSQFVLCPGRIEPRKNQLGLVKAMKGTGVTVVLLGDAVPGQEKYLAECQSAGQDEVIHVPRVAHDDPLLASAYAAAGCVALCSWFETPGLVALEAAMTGCPLVLPRGGSADEYFGDLAEYVDPEDEDGIRDAVIDALAGGRSELLAAHVRHYLTWDTTAEITTEAYAKIIA
jgi:glycosyltransferase involved in cell wall biosynthesis